MPRCGSCNKFVGIDIADPEADSVTFEVNDHNVETRTTTVVMDGDVRLVKTCAECSDELEEYTDNVNQEGALVHGETCEIVTTEDPDDVDRLISCEEPEAELTERGEPPSAPARYQKRMIGATVRAKATCNSCGAEVSVEGSVETPASGFDPLY